MNKYREVVRCKGCGKIYPDGVEHVCGKCGAKIAISSSAYQLFGLGLPMNLTDNAEKMIAKRKLFGWKVKGDTP